MVYMCEQYLIRLLILISTIDAAYITTSKFLVFIENTHHS